LEGRTKDGCLDSLKVGTGASILWFVEYNACFKSKSPLCCAIEGLKIPEGISFSFLLIDPFYLVVLIYFEELPTIEALCGLWELACL
jgi:hypothetical protein